MSECIANAFITSNAKNDTY